MSGHGLTTQNVVVTGAGRGIGRALAVMAASEGARVVVNDLDGPSVQALAAEIGGLAVVGDASSESGVDQLVTTARDYFGIVDIWFGNAGIDRGRGLEATDDDWSRSHEVNVLAHVRAAQRLLPDWLARGHGRYVVTASAAGLLTMLGNPVYAVTKHAAVAFAEWLSITYRHRGIVVQAICPQGVKTDMLAGAGPLVELLSHDVALEPRDVANCAREALADDRFLVLPHPAVADYYATRATSTEKWLTGMNNLQRRFDSGSRR